MYANQTWARRASAGLCPRCGKRPPREGRIDCAVCGTRQSAADAVRRAANPEEKRERNRAYYVRRLARPCPCGCGEVPTVQIGARWYCTTTAALLKGTP